MQMKSKQFLSKHLCTNSIRSNKRLGIFRNIFSITLVLCVFLLTFTCVFTSKISTQNLGSITFDKILKNKNHNDQRSGIFGNIYQTKNPKNYVTGSLSKNFTVKKYDKDLVVEKRNHSHMESNEQRIIPNISQNHDSLNCSAPFVSSTIFCKNAHSKKKNNNLKVIQDKKNENKNLQRENYFKISSVNKSSFFYKRGSIDITGSDLITTSTETPEILNPFKYESYHNRTKTTSKSIQNPTASEKTYYLKKLHEIKDDFTINQYYKTTFVENTQQKDTEMNNSVFFDKLYHKNSNTSMERPYEKQQSILFIIKNSFPLEADKIFLRSRKEIRSRRNSRGNKGMKKNKQCIKYRETINASFIFPVLSENQFTYKTVSQHTRYIFISPLNNTHLFEFKYFETSSINILKASDFKILTAPEKYYFFQENISNSARYNMFLNIHIIIIYDENNSEISQNTLYTGVRKNYKFSSTISKNPQLELKVIEKFDYLLKDLKRSILNKTPVPSIHRSLENLAYIADPIELCSIILFTSSGIYDTIPIDYKSKDLPNRLVLKQLADRLRFVFFEFCRRHFLFNAFDRFQWIASENFYNFIIDEYKYLLEVEKNRYKFISSSHNTSPLNIKMFFKYDKSEKINMLNILDYTKTRSMNVSITDYSKCELIPNIVSPSYAISLGILKSNIFLLIESLIRFSSKLKYKSYKGLKEDMKKNSKSSLNDIDLIWSSNAHVDVENLEDEYLIIINKHGQVFLGAYQVLEYIN